MKSGEFKKLVVEGLEAIPKKFRDKLNNVAVVIEDQPTPAQLKKGGIRRGAFLLGLYEGIPQTNRWRYNAALPDKITIFRKSIEQYAPTPSDIPGIVRDTVWHEIAHHFGLDHYGIARLERRRRLGSR